MPPADVVVLSAARTPLGRYGGSFQDVHPAELGAVAARAAIERAGISPADIDDCGDSNGPLRVIPPSHTAGQLSAVDIERPRAETREFVCRARRGDILVMRPLLLHASTAAVAAGHRRVLHIEYAADALPASLTWFEQPLGQSITRLPNLSITPCA
jgi:hypothetical protein